MTVGERIKELRNKLGISQVDFADRIKVSKQTLYKYENNIITNIPSDKIEAAARICNVSPSYLMGWEDEDEMRMIEEQAKEYQNYAIDELLGWVSDDVANHIREYMKLSADHKKLVDKYMEKIISIQEMDDILELKAAHERVDAKITEDMKNHDSDIMNDDSEWK
jgi:predicted transcriptional regulators